MDATDMLATTDIVDEMIWMTDETATETGLHEEVCDE